MDRRDFLKGTAAMAVLATSPYEARSEVWSPALPEVDAPIPRRALGGTGERVSILGFPGTAVMDVGQGSANELVARAFDRGVNLYDVSPSYGDAEERLGPALAPYRRRCFLASKTDHRDRAAAEKGIERSLKVLRTDVLDLYQHHAVEWRDLERIAAPGGAMEAFLAAKRAGKVRYLGLSTHSVEVALDAMDRLPLDTIMFPVNFVLWSRLRFGPQVVERARAKKLGVLAIKGLARGRYRADQQGGKVPKCWYEPCSPPEEAGLAWRWALAQDVDASIPSGNAELLRLALALTAPARTLSAGERARLDELSRKADPLFPPEDF